MSARMDHKIHIFGLHSNRWHGHESIRPVSYTHLPAKLEDPSLIIYAPVRVLGDETIVTNGDQTDTVYEGREKGLTFEESLRSREFEPDGPNYTPRISGLMKIKDGTFHYAMSILKSNNGNPESCNRFTYTYENPIAGEGRFIHTYMHDGNPLPSFEGEPKLVAIEEDIDDFTNTLWNLSLIHISICGEGNVWCRTKRL